MALQLVAVWGPQSLHEILFIPYNVHLHFLLFTCFFWNILSYLTQIHQIQNVVHLWKWKDLWVSRKFFWSVEIEQPLLVAKLTRAEINGFRAGRCVWRPPSRHEILFIPDDVHLHFLLFTCFFWKIWSCLNQLRTHLQTSKWSASYVRCST